VITCRGIGVRYATERQFYVRSSNRASATDAPVGRCLGDNLALPEASFPPLRAYGLSRVVHWQPERSGAACSEAVISWPDTHLPTTFDRYSAFFFGGVFGMPAVQPPSITADVPVTNDESSEAR
jgi:hypothetical protein